MAGQKQGLALAFLQTKPAAAARLLELQPPSEVATFLESIPFSHTTGVFERMLPHHAAKICAQMPPEACAATLAPLDNHKIASILRYLPVATHQQISALFPEKVKLTLRIVFDYSDDSIGAWMIPNGLALPSDCKVSEALERVKEHDTANDHDLLPVIDRDGLLQGEASLRKLLIATPDLAITSIMQPVEVRLFGRANLETESKNPGWKTRDTLPVVNSRSRLVGILRHTDLRRGLEHAERPADESEDQGIISQMMQAYTACFVALANTLFESEKR